MKDIRRLGTIAAGAILAAGLTVGSLSAPLALASGYCVNTGGTGGCYSTIQAALNAAPSGSTIHVAAGTYHEDLLITKAITLKGAGASSSIIDASSASPTYGVTIQGVKTTTTITGFTVEKAPLAGIQVAASTGVVISRNTVQGNDTNLNLSDPSNPSCAGALPFDAADCGEGINLNGAVGATVNYNTVQNNAGGILVSDEFGASHGNVIENNAIENNVLDCGITLASHPHSFPMGQPGPGYGVYGNLVKLNSLTNNGGAGVGIFDPTPGTKAYNNTVINNVISGNGLAGVMLHSHAPNQNLSGNKILDNWIGQNNLFGDTDSGDLATTGILAWSAVSHLTGLVVEGNVIVGGNHFGVWIVGPIKSHLSHNSISAQVKIYKHA